MSVSQREPISEAASMPLIIDSATTQDRDDALWVQPAADGAWQVCVWIADVAGAVAIDGAVDQHAHRQGATIYLPGGETRPMLQRAVTATRSLAAGRPCATLEIAFTLQTDGTISAVALRRTTIAHGVVLTYEQATAALSDASSPIHHELAQAHLLAQVLFRRRQRRGALAWYDLVNGWATSEEGALVPLPVGDRNAGYLIVQECMIAANEAIAHFAALRELPLLFRNHRASPLAPQREQLQTDLALLGSGSRQVDPATISSRLGLLLRPATYGWQVEGHFGLNLPYYTHATSPLRRYADLVNQRILLAAVDGQPSPYTPTALADIATHLTTQDAARRERRAERNAELRREQTRQTLAQAESQARYETLDPEAFHKLLKLAIAEGRDSEQLRAEAQRRLEHSLLASRDLHQILFKAQAPGWQALRRTVLLWLCDHTDEAVSALDIERTLRQWDQVTYEEAHSGPDHDPCFTARAALRTGPSAHSGDPLTSGQPQRARSRKHARQRAVVSLLAVLSDFPDLAGAVDDDEARALADGAVVLAPGTTSHTTAAANDNEATSTERSGSTMLPPEPAGQQPITDPAEVPVAAFPPPLRSLTHALDNPVGALNEYAQAHRLPQPTYTFSASGPAHAPTIACTVTLTLRSTPAPTRAAVPSLMATASGTSKATAKAAAAALLCQQLAATGSGSS